MGELFIKDEENFEINLETTEENSSDMQNIDVTEKLAFEILTLIKKDREEADEVYQDIKDIVFEDTKEATDNFKKTKEDRVQLQKTMVELLIQKQNSTHEIINLVKALKKDNSININLVKGIDTTKFGKDI